MLADPQRLRAMMDPRAMHAMQQMAQVRLLPQGTVEGLAGKRSHGCRDGLPYSCRPVLPPARSPARPRIPPTPAPKCFCRPCKSCRARGCSQTSHRAWAALLQAAAAAAQAQVGTEAGPACGRQARWCYWQTPLLLHSLMLRMRQRTCCLTLKWLLDAPNKYGRCMCRQPRRSGATESGAGASSLSWSSKIVLISNIVCLSSSQNAGAGGMPNFGALMGMLGGGGAAGGLGGLGGGMGGFGVPPPPANPEEAYANQLQQLQVGRSSCAAPAIPKGRCAAAPAMPQH